jgi:hypothetical protein
LMLYDIITAHSYPGEYVFMLLVFAAAWMTGRSVANEWKPIGYLIVYSLLLAAAARFLHYALYQASFLSLTRYLIDLVPITILTWLGFQMTRTNQMVTKYYWMYDKVSPISYRQK